ncbi:hypothetical protein PG637_08190 [Riemerella anatipestifer]|uniref:hypothetical protein n=1 Tax=Riemerella anatipestifer TaxID=34085 RepID=UPI002A870D90|nr:hypothetical protein [Riemerella anatipestifer]MDY3325642.1 hypothetical protein [Riemerella anatipestifer]MDY3353955.1 hypothetical protein [Riemerella anatipestifer]
MKIEELKKRIPRGGLKKIAKRSKLHYITVIDFFNGKKKLKEETKAELLIVTAKYLKELEAKKEKAKKLISEL